MKRRHRAIGPATKAQRAYQDAQRAGGCAYCRMMGLSFKDLPSGYSPCGATEIHHRTVGDLHGNPQLGQDHTVALGAWHHRGQLMSDKPTRDAMRAAYGPSLHHNKRSFLDLIADTLMDRSTLTLQRWQDKNLGITTEAQDLPTVRRMETNFRI